MSAWVVLLNNYGFGDSGMLGGKKLCARVKIEWMLKQSNAMLCQLEMKPMKFHEVPFLLSTLQRSTATLDWSVATQVTTPCCCGFFFPRFWMHARKANKTGLRGYSQSCRYVFSLWWALPSAQRKRERERERESNPTYHFTCIYMYYPGDSEPFLVSRIATAVIFSYFFYPCHLQLSWY